MPGAAGGAAGGDVVGVGHRGGVVGGAVVDGDRLAAGVGQADGEVIAVFSAVALVAEIYTLSLHDALPIFDDGAHPLAVGDGGVDRRVEVDEEGLGGLELGVAHDLHGHRVAGLTRGEDDGAAGGGVVVVGAAGRVVGRAVGGGDRLPAGLADA